MNNSVVVKFKGASKRFAMIGPVLIIAFSAFGLLSGTFDFRQPQYTSHDRKLDVLALPLTCIIPNLQKPRTLIYRKRFDSPSGLLSYAGNVALQKWLAASAAERDTLVDDIIASSVLIGMSSSKATELLGQPHYTEPTIVSPHTYVYMMDDQTEFRVSTDKNGQVRGAELVIELNTRLLPHD